MDHKNNGFINDAFEKDNSFDTNDRGIYTIEKGIQSPELTSKFKCSNYSSNTELEESAASTNSSDRDKWGKDIEFLLSCIAMSVGLGNVWRFPFTALENGGGAFLIPYLIVLFLVGKPVYYMEMLLGQFSSRGSIKVYDLAPAMRGVGYGQVFCTGIVTTYYASLMALTIRYFFASFSSILPWSYCREEWGSACSNALNKNITDNGTSSAEFYFTNVILKEKATINDGIGYPNWELVLCLLASWIIICLISIKGVQSSGKASYVLAVFPYVVMLILLIRALTLPGSLDGVLYFIKPQWEKLLDAKVWFAAVTQVFFSLAICFGNVVMYASYNRFSHNIYKDVNIITSLDTLTSLLAGVIVFGILGNLAYETGAKDITHVVRSGAGLAFISYPDAIAKFDFIPQLFAVLFFIMLFVLGIGSNVAMTSCLQTVIRDRFTNLKHWLVSLFVSIVGFCIGIIYLTPGGQHVLNLLDYFGVSSIAFVLAIAQLIAIGWIYGVKRLCKDVEFMLGISTGIYYRLCWAIITPVLMLTILVYSIMDFQPLQYKGQNYPDAAYIFGWCLTAFGVLQLPLWGFLAIKNQNEKSLIKKISSAFKPQSDWGPLDKNMQKKYKEFITNDSEKLFRRHGFWFRIYDNIFG